MRKKFWTLLGASVLPLSAMISCSNADSSQDASTVTKKDTTKDTSTTKDTGTTTKEDPNSNKQKVYVALDDKKWQSIQDAVKLAQQNSDFIYENIGQANLNGLTRAINSDKKPSLFLLGDNDGMSQARIAEDDPKRLLMNIDLKKISSKEFDPTNKDESKKQKFDFLDPKLFYQGMWNAVAIPGKFTDTQKEVVGLPRKVEAKSLYIRTSWLDKTKNIWATVPKLTGGFEIADTGIPLTFYNINKFIMDAGDSTTALPGKTTWSDAPPGWLKAGPLAQYQRIASVVNSIDKDTESVEGTKIKSGFSKDMGLNWPILASINEFYNKENMQIDFDKIKAKFTRANGLTDTSILNKMWQGFYGYYQNGNLAGKKHDFPLFQDPNYYPKFHAINGENYEVGGEGELVTLKDSPMVEGPNWMHGTIRRGWQGKKLSYPMGTYAKWDEVNQKWIKGTTSDIDLGNLVSSNTDNSKRESVRISDAEFQALPVPFSEGVTNSWSIPKKSSGAQVKGAMLLIRAIMHYGEKMDTPWSADFSTVLKFNRERISGYQKYKNFYSNEKVNEFLLKTYQTPYLSSLMTGRQVKNLNNMFAKNPVEILSWPAINVDGISGTFRKTSSSPLLNKFGDEWDKQRKTLWNTQWDTATKKNGLNFNLNDFKQLIKDVSVKAWTQIDIS